MSETKAKYHHLIQEHTYLHGNMGMVLYIRFFENKESVVE